MSFVRDNLCTRSYMRTFVNVRNEFGQDFVFVHRKLPRHLKTSYHVGERAKRVLLPLPLSLSTFLVSFN